MGKNAPVREALLGSIPLDPAKDVGGDTGKPVVIERPDSPTGRAFSDLAERLIELTEVEV